MKKQTYAVINNHENGCTVLCVKTSKDLTMVSDTTLAALLGLTDFNPDVEDLFACPVNEMRDLETNHKIGL